MIGTRRVRPVPLLAAIALAVTAPTALCQTRPPYRDSTLSTDARVRDLIGRMSIDDKFWQLFMLPGDRDSADDYSHGAFGLQICAGEGARAADDARAYAARVNAIQRYFVDSTPLGIPIIPFDEAVHGLVRPGATVFPLAIALASTFDTALVARVSDAIADEVRSRGIRQVLSPVVNIASDVRWGRVEETYGEDPVLSSAMARAFVGAFERRGVVATPKHLVANVGEGGRDSYPIDVDRRELEERFFPPFRSAIQDAHARSVMSAYNSVDGSPATQNHMLLTDVLRSEWGFQGFVISDAAATGGATVLHDTEASTASATKDALDAGLDVIFQSSYPQHRPYLDAFRRGLIADSVDRHGRRARPARQVRPRTVRASVCEPRQRRGDERQRRTPRAGARSGARVARPAPERTLDAPLRPSIKSVAVIGVDAAEARLGGYSGPGVHPVSILDALRARLAPRGVVRYAPGPGRSSRAYAIVSADAAHVDGRTARRSTDSTASTSTTTPSPASPRSCAPTRASTLGGRSTRPRAASRSTGIPCAGRDASRCPRARAFTDSASRGTTAIAYGSTASSSSTTGASSRTARTSRTSRSRRGRRTTSSSSTSRAPAMRA